MKNDNLDHAPIVEAWLKEPSLLPASDTARLTQLVHQTPQQRRMWQRHIPRSSRSMFNVLKLAAASVVLALTGGFLFTTVLSPQAEPAPVPAVQASPQAEEAPVTDVIGPESTDVEQDPRVIDAATNEIRLRFNEGTGETVAGYTQVGRKRKQKLPTFLELSDLHALGERLVAASEIRGRDEVSGDVIVTSSDAMTWDPVRLPGDDVDIQHLFGSDEGLLAGGSVAVGKEREARLWSSADGLEWRQVSAPPAKRIHQIVLAEDGLTLVRAGNQVWIGDGEDGAWRVWNKVPNSRILAGPGGILTWQGGGQELITPTVVLHQTDPYSAITEVALPEALQWDVETQRSPFMGIDIFALEDQWVMVGSEHKAPDTIHVSSNGIDWEDVPRPPEMSQDSVRWIEQVGEQVQGFGTLIREDTNPNGVWTWTLGEVAPAADELDGTGDEYMNEPVAWNDGHVASGFEQGRANFNTMWFAEGDAGR